MADEVKKAKAAPDPKKEAAPKDEGTSGAAVPKAEGSEATGAAPSSHRRGEGQKPVTRAYKENWNAIFTKKSGKKKKR